MASTESTACVNVAEQCSEDVLQTALTHAHTNWIASAQWTDTVRPCTFSLLVLSSQCPVAARNASFLPPLPSLLMRRRVAVPRRLCSPLHPSSLTFMRMLSYSSCYCTQTVPALGLLYISHTAPVNDFTSIALHEHYNQTCRRYIKVHLPTKECHFI